MVMIKVYAVERMVNRDRNGNSALRRKEKSLGRSCCKENLSEGINAFSDNRPKQRSRIPRLTQELVLMNKKNDLEMKNIHRKIYQYEK